MKSICHGALWQKPNLSQAALPAYSRAADKVVSQPFERELAYAWKITGASVHLPLSPDSFTFMPVSPDLVQVLLLCEPIHGQSIYAERLVCPCTSGNLWTGLHTDLFKRGQGDVSSAKGAA